MVGLRGRHRGTALGKAGRGLPGILRAYAASPSLHPARRTPASLRPLPLRLAGRVLVRRRTAVPVKTALPRRRVPARPRRAALLRRLDRPVAHLPRRRTGSLALRRFPPRRRPLEHHRPADPVHALPAEE